MPHNEFDNSNKFPDSESAGRYSRQVQLSGFGQSAQQKLKEARVLVVGAGGLGVPVLQYLTGMGIGTIGVIDADVVSLSNLHRQVLYNENDVGKSKVETAVNKLSKLNRQVSFKAYNQLLSVKNALEIIINYDIVVDATDNISTRYLINDACVISNKPFVYGAVQQFEGYVSVFNYLNGPTYRCLYPTPPANGEIPDCNTAGVLGVTPAIVGSQQALQVVKLITGIGKTLSGYLQIFDFLQDEQYKMKLKVRPESRQITALKNSYAEVVCNTVLKLSVDELFDWYESGKKFQLIDVRELKDFITGHLTGAVSVPYNQFNAGQIKVNAKEPIVMFCQKGARSNSTAQMLQQKYPQAEIYSVLGGMEYWEDEFDDEYMISPGLQNGGGGTV
ncbi:HesA/MoeB/ThiF family protein [uncultured Mucilaginibacter sp.]|uniref:HesA/MoeB/ThiF family protein n=1 Tax=uncultured Mucilaginibacter sp. TaxID=797541 RepID=UPI0025CF205D|nr:HesA/MoeB/ThiF family protein [uncultured Mucilaginibacter sp.]